MLYVRLVSQSSEMADNGYVAVVQLSIFLSAPGTEVRHLHIADWLKFLGIIQVSAADSMPEFDYIIQFHVDPMEQSICLSVNGDIFPQPVVIKLRLLFDLSLQNPMDSVPIQTEMSEYALYGRSGFYQNVYDIRDHLPHFLESDDIATIHDQCSSRNY